MRLVLATTNAGKIREIRQLLDGLPVELVGLDGYPDLPPPEETGATFADNARLKAIYYANATGLRAVADDSGLEIDLLDGRPGVYSARYGGEGLAYPARFAMLGEELAARGATESPGRFVCAVALAEAGRVVFEAEGLVEGRVIPGEPRGTGGFGYDPIFHYPPFGQTLAEIGDDRKASVSHRGRALRQLLAYLQSS